MNSGPTRRFFFRALPVPGKHTLPTSFRKDSAYSDRIERTTTFPRDRCNSQEEAWHRTVASGNRRPGELLHCGRDSRLSGICVADGGGTEGHESSGNGSINRRDVAFG